MKNFYKNHPILVLVFSALIFITIILLVTALSLKDTTEIELRVAPASATITIDDKVYQTTLSVFLPVPTLLKSKSPASLLRAMLLTLLRPPKSTTIFLKKMAAILGT